MGKEEIIREYMATIGALGGSKKVKKGFGKASAKERSAAGKKGMKARWEQYYRDHPEKLKERRAREKAKGGK